MTDDIDRWDLNRRSVLKSAAAATAIGFVGIPRTSGNAAAATTTSDFKLYAVEHNSHTGSDRPDRLLEIDSTDLDSGNSIGDPISVKTYDLIESGTETPTQLNTATLAADPNGYLYGLNRAGAAEAPGSPSDSQVFRIQLPTGSESTLSVEFIGSGNRKLYDIWASAFTPDGNWYGVDSGSDTLYSIDPTTGATTAIGGLTVAGEPYDAVHVGMGVNFVTDELWLVSGNKPNGQSDIFKVDTTDGSLEYATNGQDALTAGRLVGGAFGPCANVLHVVRNRHDLYGFDVGDGTELTFGSLQYTVIENEEEVTYDVGIDNLAVPYGYVCEECVDCEDEGEIAKYEFECLDYDEELEECARCDFVLEGEGDENISYTAGSYTSKEDEECEPMTATFSTEYCELYALVKSGQEFEVQGFEDVEGTVTVETANDDKFAISFVAFYCTEEAAQEALENFPSRGRGR